MAASKFFRVAVEGDTTDGRKIERSWIQQMAATYSRTKYGARIFAEHIRGMLPDGPFRAFGDVTALKAEEIADGNFKGRMALYAQVEPSEAMVQLIKSGQKIYTSIEVDPDFVNSGFAYLTGLGITDSPASLGTEVLAFAAQHPAASPFTARKRRPENLFSAAQETAIELIDVPEPAPAAPVTDAAMTGLFAKLASFFDKFAGPAPAPAPVAEPSQNDVTATFAQDLKASFTALADALSADRKTTKDALAAMATHQVETDTALAAFVAEMDTTPAGAPRPPATGGAGAIVTDC